MMTTIKFLVLSDTHDSAFPEPKTLPTADVVLHCGDLTMIGGLSNYRQAIQQLAACPAELKLVIPGNHDVSMDPDWWQANLDDDDDPEEPQKAQQLFKDAEDQGVRLLSEGTHTITLKDGRSFTIYASPNTPEFGGYAFSYSRDNDTPFGGMPTASGPGPAVDIVMTHGPPANEFDTYQLDLNRDGEHCGCPKLWEAIARCKPRLHCFGHIHEGYGTKTVGWASETRQESAMLEDVTRVEGQNICLKKEPLGDLHAGTTCMVNAALMVHGAESDKHNKPWLVEMEI